MLKVFFISNVESRFLVLSCRTPGGRGGFRFNHCSIANVYLVWVGLTIGSLHRFRSTGCLILWYPAYMEALVCSLYVITFGETYVLIGPEKLLVFTGRVDLWISSRHWMKNRMKVLQQLRKSTSDTLRSMLSLDCSCHPSSVISRIAKPTPDQSAQES